jgi:hypothetical protein
MLMLSKIFVDKSLFIKNILELDRRVFIITRPRRWGKSILITMLYLFFNMVVDNNGQPLKEESKKVFFTGGKYLFGGKTYNLK